MKYLKSLSARQSDETEAEESYVPKAPPKRKQRRRRTPKYQRELKRLAATAKHIKIMRFRAKKLGKTLRVYCYDEDSLGWPLRFIKKVREMSCDNDQDSDQEGIEHDKQKCLASLFQAIQQHKTHQIQAINTTG